MRVTPTLTTDDEAPVAEPEPAPRHGGFADWPLRAKILATVLPLVIVPLAILGLLLNTTSTLTANVEESAASRAAALQRQLANATAKVAQEVQIVVNSADAVIYGTPSGRNAFLARLNGVWQYTRIDAYDASGTWVGGTTEKEQGPSPVETAWYRAATQLSPGEVVFSAPEITPGGTTLLNVAAPVYRADGKLLGTVRFEWEPTELAAQARAVAGPGQRVDLVAADGQGFISTQADSTGASRADRPAFSLSRQQNLGTTTYTYEGVPLLAAYAKVPSSPRIQGLDWSVIVEERADQALGPVDTLRTAVAVLGLLSVLSILLAVLVLARAVTRPVAELTRVAHSVQEGDLDARATVYGRDELGQVAVATNTMLDEITVLVQTREERDALQAQISKLLDEVSTVAEGDLTVQADVTADVLGSVADAFNYMVSELRSIIENVNRTTVEVASSTTQILETSGELATQSQAQAQRIAEATAAVETVATFAATVAVNAATGSEIAVNARHNASEGAEAVRQTVEGMYRIRDQVQETSKKIKRLGESSQEIGQIVQLIEDIADQTNLLALNAAIQAAMAGEHGRGFAVVADEVRRLAERATAATKQIAELVNSIQADTAEAVLAMENGTREVVDGSRLADAAGQRLEAINQVVVQLAELNDEIARAAGRQATASAGVKELMAEISQTTSRTTAGTQQAAESVDYLARLAEQLRASVAAFRLGATDSSTATGAARG
jgi:methyl-accepting chemotaxis protein